VYTYQKEKYNLTFLFSPFRSYIDTKMDLHGFQERMFSIQEQRSQFKNNVLNSRTMFLDTSLCGATTFSRTKKISLNKKES